MFYRHGSGLEVWNTTASPTWHVLLALCTAPVFTSGGHTPSHVERPTAEGHPAARPWELLFAHVGHR